MQGVHEAGGETPFDRPILQVEGGNTGVGLRQRGPVRPENDRVQMPVRRGDRVAGTNGIRAVEGVGQVHRFDAGEPRGRQGQGSDRAAPSTEGPQALDPYDAGGPDEGEPVTFADASAMVITRLCGMRCRRRPPQLEEGRNTLCLSA